MSQGLGTESRKEVGGTGIQALVSGGTGEMVTVFGGSLQRYGTSRRVSAGLRAEVVGGSLGVAPGRQELSIPPFAFEQGVGIGGIGGMWHKRSIRLCPQGPR